MFVIYYITKENAVIAVKDMTNGVIIGKTDKKYLMSNVRQYNTFRGADMIAKRLLKKFDIIKSINVVTFKDFEDYINNLTCKCGCNEVILPIGGGCYNIPNVGIIKPSCYDRIVPKQYQGTIFAINWVDLYVHNHPKFLTEFAKLKRK